MVEDIIKAVNHAFVYVSYKSIDQMLMNCKEKLFACSQRNGGKFEAFFDCDDCNEKQLIELLHICQQSQTIFLGFVEKEKYQYIHIYDKKIYPGEKLTFEHDILILQDIPFDSYIECYGNMIVLGKVQGCIDFYYEDCKCIASSFNEARIRIFDSEYQIMTSFLCVCLYYENNQVKKEENTWDVALGLPQVRAV